MPIYSNWRVIREELWKPYDHRPHKKRTAEPTTPLFDLVDDLPVIEIMRNLATTPRAILRMASTSKRMHALARDPRVWECIDVGVLADEITPRYPQGDLRPVISFIARFPIDACQKFMRRTATSEWIPLILRMHDLRALSMYVRVDSPDKNLEAVSRQCPNPHTLHLESGTYARRFECVEPPISFPRVRDVKFTGDAFMGKILRVFPCPERVALVLHDNSLGFVAVRETVFDVIRHWAPTLHSFKTSLDRHLYSDFRAPEMQFVGTCQMLQKWRVPIYYLPAITNGCWPALRRLTIYGFNSSPWAPWQYDCIREFTRRHPGIAVGCRAWVSAMADSVAAIPGVVRLVAENPTSPRDFARILEIFPDMRTVCIESWSIDRHVDRLLALLHGTAPSTGRAPLLVDAGHPPRSFETGGGQLRVRCTRTGAAISGITWAALIGIALVGKDVTTVRIDYDPR